MRKGKTNPKKHSLREIQGLSKEGLQTEKAILKLEEQEQEAHHVYAHAKHAPAPAEAEAEKKREQEAHRKEAEKNLMNHAKDVDEDTARIISHVWESKLPARQKRALLSQARRVLYSEEYQMGRIEQDWLSKRAREHLEKREKWLKKEIKTIDSELKKLKKST